MHATKKARAEEPAAPPPLALADLEAGKPVTGGAAAAPTLVYGVVAETESGLVVAIEDGARPARRAKSCLVAPEAGDRVLCAVDGANAYVLAVLDGAVDTRVVTAGKLEVRAESLSLSGESVAVQGASVSLDAGALRLKAKSALAVLDELRLLGGTIEANVADRAVLLAERVETRATRILQRAKQVFRFVDDLEQVRLGNYDLRAEGLAAIRAENTIVSARLLSKLDGEQVKIG